MDGRVELFSATIEAVFQTLVKTAPKALVRLYDKDRVSEAFEVRGRHVRGCARAMLPLPPFFLTFTYMHTYTYRSYW